MVKKEYGNSLYYMTDNAFKSSVTCFHYFYQGLNELQLILTLHFTLFHHYRYNKREIFLKSDKHLNKRIMKTI